MQNLIVFNIVSLDGYFTDRNGDMSWAHKNDPEWNAFAEENARGAGSLLFGRITYEMMAGFWPTPIALQASPVVAERMNNALKVVFSRTLEQAAWNNTTLVKAGMVDEVRRMKEESSEGLAILGSGSIVARLAQERLIDEYQIVIVPVALGSGRTLFDGLKEKRALKHTKTRTFSNGNVLLCYQPAAV